MADRYDKALIAQRLKLGEIGVALVGVLGFATHSVFIMFIALFLFGVIGSLFGPIKYGILPDHLQRSELPAGNALVEGATFIAILLGPIVGGLAAKDGGDPTIFALLMIAFSVMCWSSSQFIPPTGEAAPDLVIRSNIFASTGESHQPSARRPPHLVGRDRDELVLAGRRGLAFAAAAAGQERARRHRGSGDDLSRHLLDLDRDRLGTRGLARGGTHHPAADADRRGPARPVLASTSAGRFGAWRRRRRPKALATSSVPAAASTWRSISPGSRSPAVCSSCRRSRRCRPGPAPTAARAWSPASTCSTPPS